MWNSSKRRRALKTLHQYGQPHRRWLCTGILATIGVVLCRLAMPWPLRGAVEMIFPGDDRGRLENLLPAWGEPILWIGASYVLAALGCGIFELFQRTHLRRFAAGTVRDLRASAVRGIRYSRRSDAVSGDLVARIIGDSARVKAGLTGILVHGLQNGLLFLGVCGVLLWLSPWLGLVFLVAGLVVVCIGVRSSIPVASKAHKQRRKEGEYATAIQEGIAGGFIGDDAEELNESSTRDDLKTRSLRAGRDRQCRTLDGNAAGKTGHTGARRGFPVHRVRPDRPPSTRTSWPADRQEWQGRCLREPCQRARAPENDRCVEKTFRPRGLATA
jgi:ABC-type multidrug transport system fused ATPase/permease subunit